MSERRERRRCWLAGRRRFAAPGRAQLEWKDALQQASREGFWLSGVFHEILLSKTVHNIIQIKNIRFLPFCQCQKVTHFLTQIRLIIFIDAGC
jgi:hypothetical protein